MSGFCDVMCRHNLFGDVPVVLNRDTNGRRRLYLRTNRRHKQMLRSFGCLIKALLSTMPPQVVLTNDLPVCINKAVNSLKLGKIIAIPTDTIYGIAALAQNTSAIQRIYQLKNRNHKKPIAICVADIDDVYKWCMVTISKELLTDLLPGAVTLIFDRTPELNTKLNPDTHLVGIRIPHHQFVRQLVRVCGEPLALTSANISSSESTLAVQEFKEIWPMLDLVCDGGILSDTPEARAGSTVIDLSKNGFYQIIREGSAYKKTVDILDNKYNLKDISLASS